MKRSIGRRTGRSLSPKVFSDGDSKTKGINPRIRSERRGSGANRSIRVLLADDHPVVRWGLSCCLASHRRLKVVGEASDGLEAVRKARELAPDVVLMDIEMPQLNGLAATEILHREQPAIAVLLLSMHQYTGQISRIVQSGARGFLLKESPPAEIMEALCKVAAGETCFSPSVARQALQQLAQEGSGWREVQTLTQRERDVLIGIAEGLSNKGMAARLGISSRTIETHRSHISRKLNIHTVAGLTRFAISQGLSELYKEKT